MSNLSHLYSKVVYKDLKALIKAGRINTVIQAGYNLSKKYPDVPVIGNLTGPISTAASIVDPIPFLKELRKDKENAHRVINYVSDFLFAFAESRVPGADYNGEFKHLSPGVWPC